MLGKRVAAGLLVGLFFGTMLSLAIGPVLFAMLLALSTLCQLEFYDLARRCGCRVYRALGAALGAAWLLCEYLLGARPAAAPPWGSAALFAVLFAVMLRTMFDRRAKRPFETVATTLLGVFYVPVLLGYFVRLARWGAASPLGMARAGVFLVFFLVFVVKMSDTGAFAVGTAAARSIGTHPLFPRISPKKSWEGLFGGLAAGCLAGVLLALAASRLRWGPDGIFWASGGQPALPPLRAAAVSALLVAVGVFGDLIESTFKRGASIKDSASLFPGMGGLLDVVDSLVFAPVVFYVLLRLVA